MQRIVETYTADPTAEELAAARVLRKRARNVATDVLHIAESARQKIAVLELALRDRVDDDSTDAKLAVARAAADLANTIERAGIDLSNALTSMGEMAVALGPIVGDYSARVVTVDEANEQDAEQPE